ncbi:dicarboxylate/amino acid:cation symporter [Bacillus cereus]
MKAYRFPLILLSSILIGGFIGYFMGADAVALKPLGDIFLNLMFTIVVPLVFFSIASSIANMDGLKRFGKIMSSMAGTFLFTSILVAIFMIIVVKVFPPAQGVVLELTQPDKAGKAVSVADQIVGILTVSDFSKLLSRENMLALIFFSILMGIATSAVGEKGKPFATFLQAGAEISMKVVSFIMYYAPIGLAAYFATISWRIRTTTSWNLLPNSNGILSCFSHLFLCILHILCIPCRSQTRCTSILEEHGLSYSYITCNL